MNIRKFFSLLITIIVLSSLTSCVILENGRMLPPGQEKKITGDKDASKLAPGKEKK